MAIESRLQVKYNQVISKYQGYFHKPIYKFIRQMVYGILKSRHVHLSKIARSLNEPISLKKTWARLSRNLGSPGLAEELITTHIKKNKREFKTRKYWVLDFTDITKTYAEAMEGLAGVWDGSKGQKSRGYWVNNIVGVSPKEGSISLMYSELFSLDHEREKGVSENSKILSSIAQLRKFLGVCSPVVIDRGGDRRCIIEDFIQNNQEFIIRQRGDRHIYNGRKLVELQQEAKTIECKYSMIVRKTRHGKKRLLRFQGGAKRVWFPKEHSDNIFESPLWFVRLTRKNGKAESWYLCKLPVETEQEAVEMMFEGYGCRWKVEEVHRQIKTDYHLEAIQLQRYQALKNFNAIFWSAMNFIYQYLDGLVTDLIMQCPEKLSYELSISEITGFVYYKLSRAVQLIFSKHKLNDMSRHYPSSVTSQLILALE